MDRLGVERGQWWGAKGKKRLRGEDICVLTSRAERGRLNGGGTFERGGGEEDRARSCKGVEGERSFWFKGLRRGDGF